MKRSINEKYPRIVWSDLGIDVRQCSNLARKALNILEIMYLKLKSIQNMCDDLGITHETLSREFMKCCNVGPKKLLTILKIRHAIYLFGNPGLSLKEISAIVGYSNEHRLVECFNRLLGMSPTHFRNDYDEKYFIELIHKGIKKTSIMSKKRN